MKQPTSYKPSDLAALRELYQSLRGVEKIQVKRILLEHVILKLEQEAFSE